MEVDAPWLASLTCGHPGLQLYRRISRLVVNKRQCTGPGMGSSASTCWILTKAAVCIVWDSSKALSRISIKPAVMSRQELMN